MSVPSVDFTTLNRISDFLVIIINVGGGSCTPAFLYSFFRGLIKHNTVFFVRDMMHDLR